MSIDKPLSNLQLELIKMFSHQLSDEDLLEVRRMLARFFADRATSEMDRIWEENQWSNDTMDKWLKGED